MHEIITLDQSPSARAPGHHCNCRNLVSSKTSWTGSGARDCPSALSWSNNECTLPARLVTTKPLGNLRVLIFARKAPWAYCLKALELISTSHHSAQLAFSEQSRRPHLVSSARITDQVLRCLVIRIPSPTRRFSSTRLHYQPTIFRPVFSHLPPPIVASSHNLLPHPITFSSHYPRPSPISSTG